jgi:AraC family transcriptional regulator, transcriptional activator of the genes for pyochelin and ferripyochelin receptors
MDKINLANWDNTFEKAEQRIVFASGRYTDLRLSFEEAGLATGYLQSVLTPGMRLTEISLSAGRKFRLVDNETSEAAESVYVLNGTAESHFHNMQSRLALSKNRHNFQYNHHFGGEHIISSANFHALAITYDLNFLKELLQNDDDKNIGQLADCIHSKKNYLANINSLPFRGQITEVIESIRKCSFTGITRYLFLESKMMELFALQMEQVRSDVRASNSLSAIDKDKLYTLKEYIENAYLDQFTLRDLTYKFGLNEFKLKKGYKQLFQTTVFGHVHQLRMQRAKILLKERAMNVSEAAFFIGYENVSSFCTEFKKRFGFSPGTLYN